MSGKSKLAIHLMVVCDSKRMRQSDAAIACSSITRDFHATKAEIQNCWIIKRFVAQQTGHVMEPTQPTFI